ncbi:McrB family protein [Ectobacillus sp. sgz5001026]|uniref:McrB family protein n=1 Tax=Ectobacillus sp. sgz5001026 TaxID=3242473 RepID=UPI0036D40EA7
MMKQWDFCLLGVLATNEEIENEFRKSKSVFVNSQNTVQFWIKKVSTKPNHLNSASFFACYATDLQRFGFDDQVTLLDYERERELRSFLENYLFVFRPAKKTTTSQDIYLAKETELVRKSDSFRNGDRFEPIPVFSEKQHGYTFQEFCKRLIMKKHVGKIEKLSIDTNESPRFILWKDDEEKTYVIGPFISHSYAHGGFCFLHDTMLRIELLPDGWKDDVYEVSDSLAYMNIHSHSSMEELLSEGQMLESILPDDGGKEVAAAVVERDIPIPLSQLEEDLFVEHFIELTSRSGLLYSAQDLVNFHAAMKTSHLVILQGMSGIGKSRLIHAYADALGIHNEQQTLFIPVRPSWTDDSDVIGYVDFANMIYRPSDTKLLNVLIDAAKEENRTSKLYIIAFDEMNLARVEHYFSQFLSVLEMEKQERILRLYNENVANKLYNASQYPPCIPIGDNVMFVGTVNVDESTYHFSDKVLDRANVITLEVVKYSTFIGVEKENPTFYSNKRVDYHSYRKFGRSSSAIPLSEDELQWLWDVHESMHDIDARAGIGPRIVRQVDAYVRNVPNTNYVTRADALDFQFVQRVLTKIRGSEEVWKSFIGTYDEQSEEVVNSKLLQILQRYDHLSPFIKSRQAVKQKAKELKYYGYVY